MPERTVTYTPVEQALLDALKDVVHCGDYGTLWINETDRGVHLTMGDADGEPELGYTSFERIAELVRQAVAPFWPEWAASPGSFEIADEWSPQGQGWEEVGRVGREATVHDALPFVWRSMIDRSHPTEPRWAYSDDVRLRTAYALERQASVLNKAALELVRPLVQNEEGRSPYYGPEHATPEAGKKAATAAVIALSGVVSSEVWSELRQAVDRKGR